MRLVIVSNRLPVTISKDLSGPEAKRSIGGLVTGIGSYLATIEKGQTCFDDYVWVGWPGASIKPEEWPAANGLIPVFLEDELVQQYYYGYCNKVLWPLFHYFPNYIQYDAGLWASYQKANEAFCEVLKAHLHPGDVVWIHDYHL
ncbi:MAG TPA: trehalose-6-phosphate synthase, partial [Chitinophagaceae bacterium]|nr:trehalose-6-phosphate synthase [Chitinophagaceae bacterium]